MPAVVHLAKRQWKLLVIYTLLYHGMQAVKLFRINFFSDNKIIFNILQKKQLDIFTLLVATNPFQSKFLRFASKSEKLILRILTFIRGNKLNYYMRIER
jgi:hypothetical protein